MDLFTRRSCGGRVLRFITGILLAIPVPGSCDDGSQGTGEAPLYPLEVGTTWEYGMSIHVFPAELVRGEGGQVTEAQSRRLGGKLVTELIGLQPFGESGMPLACFVNRIDGEVVGEEYSEISGEFVRSYGGRSLDRETGQWQDRHLQPPMKILQADLRPGAHWYEQGQISGELGIRRRFDVLGQEKVKTAAGQFDAIKLRQVGDDSTGTMIKRYVWYSPGVGLVRTHTVHYGDGRVTMVRVEGLLKFTPGRGVSSGASNPQANSVDLEERAIEGGE